MYALSLRLIVEKDDKNFFLKKIDGTFYYKLSMSLSNFLSKIA